MLNYIFVIATVLTFPITSFAFMRPGPSASFWDKLIWEHLFLAIILNTIAWGIAFAFSAYVIVYIYKRIRYKDDGFKFFNKKLLTFLLTGGLLATILIILFGGWE